jgi:hypothetical protein
MLGPVSLRTLALGLALTGAAGTAARAQPPAPAQKPGAASPDAPAAPAKPDFEAARRHYQAAEEAFARGDHATAAREYGIAYDITRDPVMFFKIGQSFDKAGDCRSARVYYGRYVKEGNPSPDHRARAEALGEACVSKPGAEAATRKAARPPAPAPTAPAPTGPTTRATTTPGGPAAEPAPASPPAPSAAVTTEPDAAASPPIEAQASWQRTAAWTSVGVALALGTTAAVLGLSAASREEDIRNLIEFRDFEGEPTVYTGPARDRYADLVQEGKRLETLSIVAMAATGAAAASAAIFFVLDARAGDDDPGTGLTPTVGAGQAGLGWTGQF